MDAIRSMRLFARVAELGSFRRAAEQLDVPVATASNAVQALEKQLGVRLLQRTTRKVSLTAEGTIYYERCTKVLGELDDLDATFAGVGAKPSGVVRVDLPERLARLSVIPHLPEFFERFPDVQLRLSASDRLVDLVGESVDCVVRVGPLPDSTLVAKRLGSMKQVNAASREYLGKMGRPRRIADLEAHYAVNYSSTRTGRDLPWEYTERGEAKTIRMRSRISVSSSEAYLACCIAGLGLIQGPRYGMENAFAERVLEEVLPAHRPPDLPVHIVYPHARRLSPRVRALIDWLSASLKIA